MEETKIIQKYSEEEQALLIRFPIWDIRVWEPLQKKKYAEAMEAFYGILGFYTRSSVTQIAWGKILNGDARIRGNVSLEDWRFILTPYFSGIILTIATEELFEQIYSSLTPEALSFFHTALFEQIPGDTPEEKLTYTREKKPWLADYLLVSPLIVFTYGLIPPSEDVYKKNLPDIEIRLQKISDTLSIPFYSLSEVKNLEELYETYDLSPSEIADMSYCLGLTLLGLLPIEDFTSYAENALLKKEGKEIDTDCIQIIFQLYIQPFERDIQELKDSIELVIENTDVSVPIEVTEEGKEETKIRINKVSFPTPEMPERPKTDPNAPLILRTEEKTTNEKKGSSLFSKGFSLPFGFFKTKKQETTTPQSISVSIQTKSIPETQTEKTSREIPKIKTPSIFERIAEKKSIIKTSKATGERKIHFSTYSTSLDQQENKPTILISQEKV